MSDISQIDGQFVRKKREALGWTISDLATMACLSVKQIKQIEEGGMAAFYSEGVKLTAAKKVAGLLDMTEAQLFGQVTPAVMAQSQASAEDVIESAADFRGDLAHPTTASPEVASISRSESWHFLAQPPENPELTDEADHSPEAVVKNAESPESLTAHASPTEETTEQPPSESPADHGQASYLIKILALFLVALAAAALLRQHAGEDKGPAAVSETSPASAQTPDTAPPVVPTAAEPPNGTPAQTQGATEPPAAVNAPADSAPVATSPSPNNKPSASSSGGTAHPEGK